MRKVRAKLAFTAVESRKKWRRLSGTLLTSMRESESHTRCQNGRSAAAGHAARARA